MQGATPWFASLRGALLVTSAAVAVVGWSGAAHAQATGQVEVETQSPPLQLILTPPEPEFNVVLVPRYSVERYEAYREAASFPVLFGSIELEGAFQVPEFTIETAGVSAGLEYLFTNGFFVGGSLNYSHADFDFDEPSPIARQRQTFEDFLTVLAATGAGDPVDREFDEYGGTVALGYFKGPLALLLTGGVSYRDNEIRRREFLLSFFGEIRRYAENIAEFDSERYSVDLGAAYRLKFGEVSLRPFAAIGYNREEVDGYLEDVTVAFMDPGELGGGFVPVGPSAPEFGETRRRFNDQTIESLPLTVGALVSVPLGGAEAGGDSGGIIGFPGLTAGISYTHDFEDQERTIIADTPFVSNVRRVIAEEENRNQDFLTLLGSLDITLFGRAFATLTYEHDFGFDERESADTVSLELRIPLQ